MLILREIVAEPHAERGGVPWTRSGHAPGRVFWRKIKVFVSTPNLSRLTDFFIFSNHIYTAPFCKLAPHKVGILAPQHRLTLSLLLQRKWDQLKSTFSAQAAVL